MPHTYRNVWAALILITTLLLLTTGRPAHASPELAIGDYQLVSSKRISRTVSEYTYKAAVINTGSDALDVSATLNINAPGVTVLDGELSFGDVGAGATVPSADTFTIRHDRVYALNESQFQWAVKATEVVQKAILDLSKAGSSQGVLIVQTNVLDEQVCGASCDHLSLELPVGTAVKLVAHPDADAVLWSWGSLPCEHLSATCEFALAENITELISFEPAQLDSTIFSVPALERHEYIDPNTGTQVIIPANATHSATTVRLDVATNQRGERLFSVEILNPESWLEGVHAIEIDMPEVLVSVANNVAKQAQRMMAQEATVTSLSIYPRQPLVPFVSYKPSPLLLFLKKIENRLQTTDINCPQITEILEKAGVKLAEKKTECSYKEHAVATPRCTSTQNSEGTCLSDAWPVILVNGYVVKDGYLDPLTLDDKSLEYWNDLPYALHKDGYAPYAFRWNTAQRFQDAADSLRELVDKIRDRHVGKPPLIVAHSFGGLVARAYAQNIKNNANTTVPSKSEVLGIVTIGTPHSGIFNDNRRAGKLYPKGGDQTNLQTDITLNRCWQISCYQAGRDIDIFQLSGFDVRQDFFGLDSEPGEIIEKLSDPFFPDQKTQVPLYALIGLQHQAVDFISSSRVYTQGDGLISWQGQRVHPGVSCTDSSCENYALGNIDLTGAFPSVFGASVKERLLGSLDVDDLTLLKPGVPVPSTSLKYYSHSPKTRNTSPHSQSSAEETQTEIFRDEHVDVDPQQHDVLVAVKEILAELIGKAPPTATGKLNDTGITTCSNNSQNGLPCPVSGFPGQDGEHGRDALAAAGLLQKVGGGSAGFDFTKLDDNGNPLPASATAWSCVKDNHTGLIWEEKATSGLRSMSHTYTWYNPDSNTNGGNPGVQNGGSCSGSSCDTHGYVQAVNAQGLCGANDWRMPAREELRGIVDYSRISPAIDTAYFRRTPLSWYWSASPYAGSVHNAWDVLFYVGFYLTPNKTNLRHVRLVRGG